MRDRDLAPKLALVDFNTPVADIVRLTLTIRNPGLDLDRGYVKSREEGGSEPGLGLEEVTKSEI